MSQPSENHEWFLCFQEVFSELENELLAPVRSVADGKFLIWSVKCVGYHKCGVCDVNFTSANSQVKFQYRVVPKHRRGEVRILKQYGQMCRKCHNMEYNIPRIDNNDKLYAMELLLTIVLSYFYNRNKDKPIRKLDLPLSGKHFEAGCEACACGDCRLNPHFRGTLIDNQKEKYESREDNNPKSLTWRLYFGDETEFFQPTFEDGIRDSIATNRAA